MVIILQMLKTNKKCYYTFLQFKCFILEKLYQLNLKKLEEKFKCSGKIYLRKIIITAIVEIVVFYKIGMYYFKKLL